MTSAASAEVVIVGGGVIGCSIAWHLTEIGVTDVVLLERHSLASGQTGVCPGGIRQQFEGEADCLLARRSVRFWERIDELLSPEYPFVFERSGYLFLAHSGETLARFGDNVERQNRLGIPSRLVGPEEVGEMLPALRLEGVAGGAFCREDGFLEDCHGVTVAFARRAEERGARIVYREARRLRSVGGGWEVETWRDGAATRLRCRHLVLAAGVDSVTLAGQVGLSLPVAGRRRRLAFTVPHDEPVLAPLVVAPERQFAGKQLADGVFYLGWLGESGEEDELTFVEAALSAGATLLSLLEDLPVRRVLAGTYDLTPDSRPVLGPVPGHAGLYLATGFSGHGFMMAPAVGEALAALVAGQPTDLPVAAFSLERFADGRDEHESLTI